MFLLVMMTIKNRELNLRIINSCLVFTTISYTIDLRDLWLYETTNRLDERNMKCDVIMGYRARVNYLCVKHLSPMHVSPKYCTELTCISEIHSNIMYYHIRVHSMYTGERPFCSNKRNDGIQNIYNCTALVTS